MKKLLIDCRLINNSGIGVYIKSILEELREYSDIHVSILVMHQEKNGEELCNLINGDVIYTRISRFNPFNLFIFNKTLSRFDFYFVPFLSILPVRIFSGKVKIISTVHDLCPIKVKKAFDWKVIIVYYMIMYLQLKFSDSIIAISNFTKNEIIDIYGKQYNNKITVIYNAARIIPSVQPLIKKCGFKSEVYGICVGNIKPHKNISRLISYWEKNKIKVKLLFVGASSGFYTSDITSMLLTNEYISFTGFITDEELHEYYKGASFFIYPSLYEGFGLPLLEAMTYKLKIFASDIPIFHEIANDSIEYFSPENFSGLKEKIEKFIASSHKEKTYYNYESILNKYSWKNSVKLFVHDLLI
ncbi:glycosyltransferase family 4 protein [Escherichia albertii]|uniref:Glycosyltransferase family 1 protein n=1 Tax=Escherichia albertii TaxID=208962 RepID=A0A5A4U893_ESCAL|nr:glycosyltransferase family 1 protein [Escherichia albertii]BBM63084.1 glycosyltransferase family 1 protein [Escherichia albertii]